MPGFEVKVSAKFQVAPAARGLVRKAFAAWLRSFLKACVREVRRDLSKPYPPASRPGEPPRMRTGELRDSIGYEVDEPAMAGFLTASAEHAGYLEKGTSRMKPRPFGLRAVKRMSGLMRGLVAISRSMWE